MYRVFWNVLVVDDEPDVLAMTKLALRRVEVFGLPVKLHTAASREEAVELLQTRLASKIPGFSQAAVAFIDVVMETDTAGLELCRTMRQDMGNRSTQIFVRTGQAGLAPERAVIDGYDISGYLHKTEATEDKLYTLVKSGCRQWDYIYFSRAIADMTQRIVAAAHSRQAMVAIFDAMLEAMQRASDGERLPNQEIRTVCIMGDRVLGGSWGGDEDPLAARERLRGGPAIPIGNGGDRAIAADRDLLISIAPGERNAGLEFLSRSTAPPPQYYRDGLHGLMRCFSYLWQLAGD
jgi:CheY-like chemotaxis protein